MNVQSTDQLYQSSEWYRVGGGPRYVQLRNHIAESIDRGRIMPNDQLPSERDLAELAGVSRVTVRKAVQKLVSDGLIEQRQGAGSFVRQSSPKLEQSLSSLVSFTENMQSRGLTSTSVTLSSGHFVPNATEMMSLGLAPTDKVARIVRLRSAGETPMAIETSSLPADILPDPAAVETSLYAVLRARRSAPARAIQRVTAANLTPDDAKLLDLPIGTAVLKIDRTGLLQSGRTIEFTSGLYRSDLYDFVSEIRPEAR